MTIYEQFHPELREKPEKVHQLTTEDKIKVLKSRIQTLEGRQPMKENQAIVRKLKREVRRLENK